MQLLRVALFAGLSAASILPRYPVIRADDPCAIVANVTVAQGDTLGGIASKSNTNVPAILKVNPQIEDPNVIYPGEVVAIPGPDCVGDETSDRPTDAICTETSNGTYTVVSGDTLTKIAASFEITLAALEEANPQITNPDLIFVGQVIYIPVCGTCVKASVTTSATYTVASGDTLFVIAHRFGITLAALEAANPQITNPDLIELGQVINLPLCAASGGEVPAIVPVSQCSNTGTYTVISGDSLSAIASSYGITLSFLEDLNPAITNPNLIEINQIINVPACGTTYVLVQSDACKAYP